jgi:sporulation integral membrane protein YlbJ
MAKLLSNRKFIDACIGFAIFCCLVGLLFFPQESVKAASDGMRLCIDVVIPSLFPFFVLSSLVVELGLAGSAGGLLSRITGLLFRINGACASAVILGFVGGYPVGAKTALSLYERGQCTKTEAERLLSFCNNSGPAFILGFVGVGIFGGTLPGVLIYAAHVIASLTVGVCFRWYGGNPPASFGGTPLATCGRMRTSVSEGGMKVCNPLSHTFTKGMSRSGRGSPRPPFGASFASSVKKSAVTMASICAFVVFFMVAIRMLALTGLLTGLASALAIPFSAWGLGEGDMMSLLTGLIEMTSGLWSLRSSEAALAGQLSMAAFILGWAGLSVHCQVLSFIGGHGLSTRTYLLGKLFHAVLSAAYTAGLFWLFGMGDPVSAHLTTQVGALAGMRFADSFRASLPLAAGLLLLFAGGALWAKHRVVNRREM